MSRYSFARAALPVLLLLAACRSDPVGPPAELTVLPRPLSASEQTAIAAGNDFSLALFRAVNERKRHENVFISPFSASMALGMALNGADGETFTAMRQTLGLGELTLTQISGAYRELWTLLSGLDDGVELKSANAIFHDAVFPFHASFIDGVRQAFDAEVQALDFGDEPAVLSAVNGWANGKTNGRIPKVLDQVDPDEVMFLSNALYFKGSWRTRFDPARTQPLPFRLFGGTQRNVSTMVAERVPLRAGFVNGVQVAELPYGNSAFAMSIILPAPGSDVDELIASLTPERWEALLAGLRDERWDVYLPKFTIRYEDEWSDVLTTLGMGVAFSSMADFSRMSERRLAISRVLQSAFVDVNEEGTEAAAVTTVGVVPVSLPPSVIVDRPFVFAIRERLSGTVLFVGKVGEL